MIQFADHFSQFLSIDKEVIRLKAQDVYKRDMSNFNEQAFVEDIGIQNWNATNHEDSNSKINDFIWRIEKIKICLKSYFSGSSIMLKVRPTFILFFL